MDTFSETAVRNFSWWWMSWIRTEGPSAHQGTNYHSEGIAINFHHRWRCHLLFRPHGPINSIKTPVYYSQLWISIKVDIKWGIWNAGQWLMYNRHFSERFASQGCVESYSLCWCNSDLVLDIRTGRLSTEEPLPSQEEYIEFVRCSTDCDCVEDVMTGLVEGYGWQLIDENSGLKCRQKSVETAQIYLSDTKNQRLKHVLDGWGASNCPQCVQTTQQTVAAASIQQVCKVEREDAEIGCGWGGSAVMWCNGIWGDGFQDWAR